tara:strand:+ start:2980 stop:3171 length:192 start_codon:yes stop_codon:yes gene_type:complete
MFLIGKQIILLEKQKNKSYRQFYYIEEIVWNCMFIFRYNRVNKLGKKFLYNFDLEIEQIKVLN